ncbi:Hypothetical predicted protein [Paramuricea clavata]|uniref:Uncharacterized protein n=1 Tax=Paramuricea clavata TaxID=317549 RepID=A0A6S7FVE1_PARCT|nr:Hypothetical predicted protein [Paramuricea clavata]
MDDTRVKKRLIKDKKPSMVTWTSDVITDLKSEMTVLKKRAYYANKVQHLKSSDSRKWMDCVNQMSGIKRSAPNNIKIVKNGTTLSGKLLPYWDWTTEFEKDCLIENPYFVNDDVMTEEDCEVCKKISGARLKNVSQDEMTNRYLFNAIPVVVTDATNDWPVDIQTFDLDNLKEIYLDTKLSEPERYCTFDAFNPEIESPHQLFALVEDQKLDHWQGYWENCEPATAKSIRKFYRRPYFLPPMAEAATENWIFAAYGSENNETKMQWEYVSFGASATWITQIKGQSQIILTATAPCDRICKKMSATLKPGETMVFVNRLWNFKRRPHPGQVSISLAATVGWDQI